MINCQTKYIMDILIFTGYLSLKVCTKCVYGYLKNQKVEFI